MRTTLLLAAFLATLLPVPEAEARRASRSAEHLLFLGPTGMSDPVEGPLSLCILTKTTSALFVNFFRHAEGYALAGNRCETESYFALDAKTLTTMREAGIIAEATPDAPRLTPAQIAAGHWGWAIVLLALGVGAISRMGEGSRRKARAQVIGKADAFTERAAQVMGLAAAADGKLEAPEVGTICAVMQQITGTRYPDEAVEAMLRGAGTPPAEAELDSLSRGMNANHRELLVKAALLVVASDGDISPKESTFMARLSNAMGIGQPQFDQIVEATFSGGAAPAE